MKIEELFAYMSVKDAGAAIEFYKKAFGVKEKLRLTEPGGRIGHAELAFGSTTLMLADEFPEYGFESPKDTGTTSCSLHIHVDNADEVIRRAIEAGAKLIREPQDQFYGERSGTIKDPFGHHWNIGHHIEDVSAEEMQRRYDQLMMDVKK